MSNSNQDDFLLKLYDPGRWTQLPLAFLRVLKWKQAVVLAYLISRSSFTKTDDGWFLIAQKRMEEDTGISKSVQSKQITGLEQMGLLESKKTNSFPTKRMIRINPKNIFQKIEEFSVRPELSKQQLCGAQSCQNSNSVSRLSINRKTQYNNRSVEPARSTRSTQRCVDGFFDLGNDQKTICTKLAIRLEKCVRSKRKIQRQPNIKSWEKEFFDLRNKDRVPLKRIKLVLSWYIENFGNTYVPVVYSAKTFRNKFLYIEDAMTRSSPSNRTERPKVVKMTKEVKTVLKDTSVFDWKTSSEGDVIRFISESLAEIKTFMKTLESMKKTKKGSVNEFVSELKTRMGVPVAFTTSWVSFINNEVSNWKQWNGQLSSFVFNPGSKKADKLFAQWSCDYLGNSKAWNELKTYLKLNEN